MSLATTDVFKKLVSGNNDFRALSETELKKMQKVLLDMMKDFDDACRKYAITYSLAGGSCLGAIRHEGFIPWDDDMDLCITRKNYEKLKKVFNRELGEKYYLQCLEFDENYNLNVPRLRKKGTIYRLKDDLDKENAGIAIDLCVVENTYDFILARYCQGFLSLACGLFTSCRNFYSNRKLYMKMARGNKNVERVFRAKILVGFLISWKSERGWAKTWDKVNRMCKNGDSKFVTVPVGRKHFFKETYMRKDFCEYKYVQFENIKLPVPVGADGYMEQLYGCDYMKLPKASERETHVFLELDFGDMEENEKQDKKSR